MLNCFLCCEKIKRGAKFEGNGWVGKKGIHEVDIPTHSIQYQPKVFNIVLQYSIPTQSIHYQGMAQYSSSIHEVDIPTHSGGQRTPRVPLQFPPFLLTLLSYWASSTFLSRTFPILCISSSSLLFQLFIFYPPHSTPSSFFFFLEALLKRSLA